MLYKVWAPFRIPNTSWEVLLMEAHVERVEKKFLSLPETADFAGISKSTVLRYVKRGIFPPPKRLGPGRVGWSIEELEAWAAARETA